MEHRLYGARKKIGEERPEPDARWVHSEYRRAGVTLELLHLEYLQAHPDGYSYTAFCGRYREWLRRRGLTMRQNHHAGEKAFLDYSGKKPSYQDRETGEVVESFFSLAELNERIAELREELNGRPMRKLGGVTRRELFERIERAALRPLPAQPFELARLINE